MRVPRRTIRTFKEDKDVRTFNEFVNDIVNLFTAGIQFGDGTAGGAENISCDFATVTFTGVGSGDELTASHALGRTHIGCWLIKADRAGNIWNSTAADSSYVYLKADSDSLSGVLIII